MYWNNRRIVITHSEKSRCWWFQSQSFQGNGSTTLRFWPFPYGWRDGCYSSTSYIHSTTLKEGISSNQAMRNISSSAFLFSQVDGTWSAARKLGKPATFFFIPLGTQGCQHGFRSLKKILSHLSLSRHICGRESPVLEVRSLKWVSWL